MASLKFGVSYHEYDDLAGVARYARRVEELGFDSLWITENVHSRVPSLEPLLTLSIFAAHTTRVSLGPAVLLLPLRNPVGLAHAIATLDRLSGGRVILGVGAGGDAPEGYQAYGVPREERGSRSDEALEIMKKLWTEPSVSFSGRFNNFSDYSLGPRPTQKPHPPIWLGGSAPAAVKRAARWGDGFFPARVTPSECSRLYDQVKSYGLENGRDMSGFTNATYLSLCLADSGEEALRISQRVLKERYTYPVTDLVPGENCLLGTPEDCIRLIEEYQAAGASHVVLDPSCPPEDILSQLETFCRQVSPHFR